MESHIRVPAHAASFVAALSIAVAGDAAFDAVLLHVDLKFVTADALAHRVENPRLLWARDATVAARLAARMAASPAQ